MWKVKVKEGVWKFLKNNKDANLKKRFKKELEILRKNPIPPNRKHVLEHENRNLLCEFAIDKFRFYYEIKTGEIVINNVVYLGKVTVLEGHSNQKSGNKNYPNQQRTIKRLKKKFKEK